MMKWIAYRRWPLGIVLMVIMGCSAAHEYRGHRDEYFDPLKEHPRRNSSIHSLVQTDSLQFQMFAALTSIRILRDSLSSLQIYSNSLAQSAQALITRIEGLESSRPDVSLSQQAADKRIIELQKESQRLSKQLAELHSHLRAEKQGTAPSVFSPARTSASFHAYEKGLSLFHNRQYENALAVFEELKGNGIEKDLFDNCEYWIGECYFASHDYRNALRSFKKVLTISSSNKIADTYFMMGRSYERIGDFINACRAYKELTTHFPENIHIRYVRSRVQAMQHAHPSKPEPVQKKMTEL